MGHIPLKNDTIGMTVGATNDHIKKILTKEPPHEGQLVASPNTDYTFYNKNYFNDNFSKDYKLEEDKIYSNRSAEAKTWICGSKFKINPQNVFGEMTILCKHLIYFIFFLQIIFKSYKRYSLT